MLSDWVKESQFCNYQLARFIGRLPILAPLHPLSLSDLVRILVEPKNALTKQYRKLFARYGCDLRFSEKALYAIAEEASKRGGSARHLRSTLEELLLDAMYEVPGSVSLQTCSKRGRCA
jgi:ATP-dependent Clp protease ATP-binding subunit ClpX